MAVKNPRCLFLVSAGFPSFVLLPLHKVSMSRTACPSRIATGQKKMQLAHQLWLKNGRRDFVKSLLQRTMEVS